MRPEYVRKVLIVASRANMTNMEYMYIVTDVDHTLYVNPATGRPAWQQGIL